MSQLRALPASRIRVLWMAVAVLSVVVGIRYVLTEPLIFEPGGWFALDGRRLLEASAAWLDGTDPYAIKGFVYSPVAVVLASPLTLVPGPVAILGWISASAVMAGALAWRELTGESAALRALAAAAVLLYIPTIADLVLANVTIALVVAAAVAVRRDRPVSGVALGVLGAAFPKPFLVPIVLWLLVFRRRSAAGAIGAGGVVSLVAVLLTGPDMWVTFVETLRAGGGIELGFVGNYGVSKLVPALALPVGIAAAAVLLWLLARRRVDASLVAATAVGPFIAPYAGIYAALPMLIVLPRLVRTWPVVSAVIAAIAVLTAPWSPIVAVLVLALALLWPDPAGAAVPEPATNGSTASERVMNEVAAPEPASNGPAANGEPAR